MCIGWPMQVTATRAGHATVRRGAEQREVRTALVGEVQLGDWLLVFLDDARERLSPERAAEVSATLALVEAALGPAAPTAWGTEPSSACAPCAPFDLPSALSAEQLAARVNPR